jgi:predicted DNA-binding ribbon-helix-helix protein
MRFPVEKVLVKLHRDTARGYQSGGRLQPHSGDAMKSLVVKRSVVVAGHKTSVSLEDAFWKSLKEIAACGDMSVSALLAAIDSQRRHGNLSSAIRLFVLSFYREQFLDGLDVRDKPEAIQALISRSALQSSTSAPSE